MSVVNPTIDDLLSVTDENRFLLCELASRRACDINDMMRNQHNRAEQLADVEDISMFMSDDEGHAPNPLSIAFDEIAPRKTEEGAPTPGLISYDAKTLHRDLGLDDEALPMESSASDLVEQIADEQDATPAEDGGADVEAKADVAPVVAEAVSDDAE